MNRQNNTPTKTIDRRTCYVGAKVTPMQRETIRELATRCGMTVSNYLLARSHGYEPKQRLTRMQTDALAMLNNCRSDIINYTSALRGMNAAKRKQLFNDHAYMLDWLNELRNLPKRLQPCWTNYTSPILFRREQRITFLTTPTYDSQSHRHIARHKCAPIHNQ